MPAKAETDWVWFEVHHAPLEHRALQGQRVRLSWTSPPERTPVTFSPEAQASVREGLIHPVRLNGRSVGPLQSLAGARAQDDVLVALGPQTQVKPDGAQSQLMIEKAPVQVPGRDVALVQLGTPEESPCSLADCPADMFPVAYFDAQTQTFSAASDRIWIPQVGPNSKGILPSTIAGLADAPAGSAGWYIYGAHNAEGLFEVFAIAPRQLFQLQPDTTISGLHAGINYINYRNWENISSEQGSLTSALLTPSESETAALNPWQLGDRALVIHIFGGIGGRQAETPGVIATVTGHFAYGVAEVIRDPLSQDLQFNIQYEQVYAHNPEGIVAGSVDWSEYMGNLRRGWAATRPVTDILVNFPPLTEDYQFGAVTLSPLDELLEQLQLMAARYRTGDGTGAALVSPAKSCVQDSSQAVYSTIQRIKQQVEAQPSIQAWLAEHPQDPQTLRFQQLLALGSRMTRELAPLGVVRSDWQHNADLLTGIRARGEFVTRDHLGTQLLSWRTVMPRVTHDRIARLFLDLDAQLWMLRTAQIGGENPDILPLAPTELLGRWPVVPRVFSRLIDAVTTWPAAMQWLICFGIGVGYCAIAAFLASTSQFIQFSPLPEYTAGHYLRVGLQILITPAFLEELIFRGLLLPHPQEAVLPLTLVIWSGISLGAFIVYHPLNALTCYKQGNPTFFQPIFLVLATLLGVTCTLMYLLSGSLWPGVLLHWLVVSVWLLALGGCQKLYLSPDGHANRSQEQP